MSVERGPHPDEHQFWRWHASTASFRRRFDDKTTAIVNYIPGSSSEDASNGGWGYVVLVAAVVVGGKYDVEWSSEDAMLAVIAKIEQSDKESAAQEKRAKMIAESRGIDLETARELVDLRERLNPPNRHR